MCVCVCVCVCACVRRLLNARKTGSQAVPCNVYIYIYIYVCMYVCIYSIPASSVPRV